MIVALHQEVIRNWNGCLLVIFTRCWLFTQWSKIHSISTSGTDSWIRDTVVGAESSALNATFSWARVNMFTCSISLVMHTLPSSFFLMAKVRWNDRMKRTFIGNSCWSLVVRRSSQKIPVTVTKVKFSYTKEWGKESVFIRERVGFHWNMYSPGSPSSPSWMSADYVWWLAISTAMK